MMRKKRLAKYSSVLPPPEYQQVSYKVNEELQYALKLAQPFVAEFADMRVLVKSIYLFLGENCGLESAGRV